MRAMNQILIILLILSLDIHNLPGKVKRREREKLNKKILWKDTFSR